MEQVQFINLLNSLQNSDNAIRSSAEATYGQLTVDQPDWTLHTLADLFSKPAMPTGENNSIRTLAVILFRRSAFNIAHETDSLWNRVTPQTAAHCKTVILGCMQNEQDKSHRVRIAHVISELVRSSSSNSSSGWEELLPFMFQCCNSPNVAHREAALEIFTSCPNIFGDDVSKYAGVISEILLKSLKPEEPAPSPTLRAEAMSATMSFLRHVNRPELHRAFAGLTVPIIQTILDFVSQNHDAVDASLEQLVELAPVSPGFFKSHLADITQVMIKIVSSETVAQSTRHLALELIVSLTECMPGRFRKMPNFVSQVSPLCFQLMVDIEDDPEWHSTTELNQEDYTSNAMVGEQAIDRIACAVRGKTFAPVLFSIVPPMLTNAQWQYRYAGVTALSATAEGCGRYMFSQLDNILNAIKPLAVDPHPRVRYAFANTVGQLATDFKPDFQTQYHGIVVPALLSVMSDPSSTRSRTHAAAAFVNFADGASSRVIHEYLDTILAQLSELLNPAFPYYVLEQAVATIATVAESAGSLFAKHYANFMPILKDILNSSKGNADTELLFIHTFDCISMVGDAVGKELFLHDATEVMNIFVQLMVSRPQETEISQTTSYLMTSCARIGSVMGPEFLNFLPYVIPHLKTAADITPEITIVDVHRDTTEEQNQGWMFYDYDGRRIGIKTSMLEDKAVALDTIGVFASKLKAHFHQHAAHLFDVVFRQLTFLYDEDARYYAACALPPMLMSVKLANQQQQLGAMWSALVPELLRAIKTEPSISIYGHFLKTLTDLIDVMGDNCLGDAHLAEVVSIIAQHFTELNDRNQERNQQRHSEDYDEEAEESIRMGEHEETQVMMYTSELFTAIWRTHRMHFLNHFRSLYPVFSDMLNGGDQESRRWAMSFLVDIIEYLGPDSFEYSGLFRQLMLEGVMSQSPELRQICVYGIGTCAMFGGMNFAAYCLEALPSVATVILASDSRNADNIYATENAISAVGKIIKFIGFSSEQGAEAVARALNASSFFEVISRWLSWLPLTFDITESSLVHNLLCDMVEMNLNVMIGGSEAGVPQVVAALASAVAKQVLEADAETEARVVNLVRRLVAEFGQRVNVWSVASQAFSQEEVGIVQARLAAAPSS